MSVIEMVWLPEGAVLSLVTRHTAATFFLFVASVFQPEGRLFILISSKFKNMVLPDIFSDSVCAIVLLLSADIRISMVNNGIISFILYSFFNSALNIQKNRNNTICLSANIFSLFYSVIVFEID
jgi:hypothetical protein